MSNLPRQLSGGEAQRVAVGVALANEPDLLLADEVVGQLDSATAAEVMEFIFTASRERGLTVLYVTHDEQLARAAQHVPPPAGPPDRRGMSAENALSIESVVVEYLDAGWRGPGAGHGSPSALGGGSSVAITGSSGGGKSTLLGLIGGLARPTAGAVRIGGQEICTLSDGGSRDFRRRHIGYVYQADNLLPFLTVLENVQLPLTLVGSMPTSIARWQLLDRLGLGRAGPPVAGSAFRRAAAAGRGGPGCRASPDGHPGRRTDRGARQPERRRSRRAAARTCRPTSGRRW